MNLLFVYTDQQRADTLAAYGNAKVHAPHLNALAARSVVFANTYVTAPICTPSRSTLLTGLWPHTNGCTENNIPLRGQTPCLPEMLPAGRYVTGHFGKWHLGDEICAQHGFDEWESVEDGYRAFYSRRCDPMENCSYAKWLIGQGLTPPTQNVHQEGELPPGGERNATGAPGWDRLVSAKLPEELSKSKFLADRAIDFIRTHRERPWALYVNFLEPHPPITGPRDGMYDPAGVDVPEAFLEPAGADVSLRHRTMSEVFMRRGMFQGCDLATEAGWRTMIARYWGLISQVDAQVGRILEALDEANLRDETLIVFTSDHGDMMGTHCIRAKSVLYEGALRVPLLISAPGVTPRTIEAPVSQIDVVPTVLEAMAASPADHLQGRSLWPHLRDGTAPTPRDVIVEWCGEKSIPFNIYPPEFERHAGARIRTLVGPEGFKLSLYEEADDNHELFDLNADPGERVNLFTRREHADRIDDMTRRLRAWQRETEVVATVGPNAG